MKLEEMVQEWKEAAGAMSYYNAAEGPSWSYETEERNKCRKYLGELTEKLTKHGVDVEELKRSGNYLI